LFNTVENALFYLSGKRKRKKKSPQLFWKRLLEVLFIHTVTTEPTKLEHSKDVKILGTSFFFLIILKVVRGDCDHPFTRQRELVLLLDAAFKFALRANHAKYYLLKSTNELPFEILQF
jgi:hypothetical protein